MIPGIVAQAAAVALAAPTPIVVTEDVYWNNVALQCTFDGADASTTFTDDSRYALTMAANGGAAILSNKLELDGSNDYATASASLGEAAPGSAVTIELFGTALDVRDTRQVLLSYNNGASGGRSWRLLVSATNELTFDVWDGSAFVTVASYSWGYTTGTLYDLAVCWDGTNLYLYVDGVRVASGTVSSFVYTDTFVRIGAEGNGSGGQTGFMNGRITALRMTRGVARGTGDVYTRHALPLTTTQAATADTLWDKVVFLLSGEGADGSTKFRDRSASDRIMTVAGSAQNDTGVSVNGTPSILLGADGTYVSGQYFPNLNITTTTPDFCMEAYGTLTAIASVNNQLFGRRRDSGQFIVDIDNGNLRFLTYNGTTGTVRLTVAAGLSINTVYHFCVIRVGTTYYAFVDGVLKGSATSGSGTVSSNSTGILVGDSETGQTTRFWRGSVNWCRITLGDARYAVTGFTPPSVPYPTI